MLTFMRVNVLVFNVFLECAGKYYWAGWYAELGVVQECKKCRECSNYFHSFAQSS